MRFYIINFFFIVTITMLIPSECVYGRRPLSSECIDFVTSLSNQVICILELQQILRYFDPDSTMSWRARVTDAIKGKVEKKTIDVSIDCPELLFLAGQDFRGNSKTKSAPRYGIKIIFLGNYNERGLLVGKGVIYTSDKEQLYRAAISAWQTKSPEPLLRFLQQDQYSLSLKRICLGILNGGTLPKPFNPPELDDLRYFGNIVEWREKDVFLLRHVVEANSRTVIGTMALCLYQNVSGRVNDTAALLSNLWQSRSGEYGFDVLACAIIWIPFKIRNRILTNAWRYYADYDSTVAQNLLRKLSRAEWSDIGNISSICLCNMLEDDTITGKPHRLGDSSFTICRPITVAELARGIIYSARSIWLPYNVNLSLSIIRSSIKPGKQHDVVVLCKVRFEENGGVRVVAGLRNISGRTILVTSPAVFEIYCGNTSHMSCRNTRDLSLLSRFVKPSEVVWFDKDAFIIEDWEYGHFRKYFQALLNRSQKCRLFFWFRNPVPRGRVPPAPVWFGFTQAEVK